MDNGLALERCRWCGESFPQGLREAHRLVVHKRMPLDPDRVHRCGFCGGTYPAARAAEHRRSARHREARLLAISFDPTPMVQAYIRGDRVRDIMADNPDRTPPDLYTALEIFDIPLRGNREPDFWHVEQRNFLARNVGHKWERVKRLRDKGKSWIEVEHAVIK